MKPSIFALATVALLWAAHHATAKDKTHTQPIPQSYAKEKQISLHLESRSQKGQFYTLKVRLINPASAPLTFHGYSEASPWYKIERLVEGRWVPHRVGWFCGTGLRECTIRPGQSSVIPVSVKNDLFPVRVGVGYSLDGKENSHHTVWSAAIEGR